MEVHVYPFPLWRRAAAPIKKCYLLLLVHFLNIQKRIDSTTEMMMPVVIGK